VSENEKSQQPTPHKVREARKKGQLPRSKLFTSASVTAGGLLGGVSLAPETSARLMWWTSKTLSLENIEPSTALSEALKILLWCVLPTLVGATVGSLVSAVVTAGLEVHLATLKPDLERLNPFEGLKKLISAKQMAEIAKAVVVTLLVSWVMWSGISAAAPEAFRAVGHQGAPAMEWVLQLLGTLVLKASLVLLAVGAVDFGLARLRHRKELMMSHHEVKQEHKNAEGDPHAKAQRRAEQLRLAQRGPARGVKRATVIVVNPTHLAIALRYDPSECEAPYVVAKGREEAAMKIRHEARANGIPIVRDVPMARALIHYDVGEEVPEELYRAAAAVLKVAQEEVERRASHEVARP